MLLVVLVESRLYVTTGRFLGALRPRQSTRRLSSIEPIYFQISEFFDPKSKILVRSDCYPVVRATRMSLRLIQASCRLSRELAVRNTRSDLKPLGIKALSSIAGSTKKTKAKAETTMKRSAASSAGQTKPKKPRLELSEYHATPSLKTESGNIIWPAPEDQIESAREFILEWLGFTPSNR